MDGVIVVYKPKGKTSHDMVAFVRRLLGMRRVGHTGTLDPDATGVLPVCVGLCTKAAEYITDSEKVYVAVMQLGASTTTQDASGALVHTAPVHVSAQEIEEAMQSFVGTVWQIPPMYSAVKVQGKKLYELARAGVEIERTPRSVEIFGITIQAMDMENHTVAFTVNCSKGTYIRTLIHDIGEKLGCHAHMTELTRTKSGGFTLEQAYTCEELTALAAAEEIEKALVPTDRLFKNDPKVCLDAENVRRVKNGMPLKNMQAIAEKRYRVYGADGAFLCLSVGTRDGGLKMIKAFWSR